MFDFLSKPTMDKKKLAEIEHLCDEIQSKIRSVNSGGCAVIAYLLAERLTNHFPTTIRVGDFYEEADVNIEDVAREIGQPADCQTWAENDVQFGHVFVEVECEKKKYHIDSTGVHKARRKDPTFGFPLYPGELGIKYAKKIANDSLGWNPTFDRKQIPGLKKMIKSFFDHFDQQFT